MKELASELLDAINEYLPGLENVPNEKMIERISPGKWSKKEILGHLIDSAQSNIRRFIVAQYEDKPYIVYNQDKWVSSSGYQQWPTSEILQLWYLLNKQLVAIWQTMPGDQSQRLCQTQEVHTLEWLAKDYIKHLRHHIHQICLWEKR